MTASLNPELTGVHNFRSLAGLTGADGRKLRPHVLLRSARLARLTAEDWEQLRAVGLGTICDLRGMDEVQSSPTVVPSHLPMRVLQFDIRNDVRSDRSLAHALGADPTPAGARRLMLEIYKRFPLAMAPRLKSLFDVLIDGPDGAALLVHCTAGKDRTGFLVSLILHALGVSPEDAMSDYLRLPPSRGLHDPRLQHMQAHFRVEAGVELSLETLVPVMTVEPDYLRAAWQAMEREYGGPDAYLRQFADLDLPRRELLRRRMLS